jgi:hypothetical protein
MRRERSGFHVRQQISFPCKRCPRQLFAIIELTGHGREYLQPELAEFGRVPMLPQVVESIEKQLQVLSYPQEEKDRLLFRLHESVAKQAPEMIVKIIAEIAVKLLTGGK